MQPLPPPPSFGQGPGPYFLGTVFNVMLYGLLVTQTVDYFLSYKRDNRWVKTLVTVLFVVDTLECALTVYSCYKITIGPITSMDHKPALAIPWDGITELVLMNLVVTTVQFFFAYRIYRLSNSRWITALAITLTTIQFLAGIAAITSDSVFKYYSKFNKAHPAAVTWFVTSAVADATIVLAVVFCLHRIRTGIASTDALISIIIRTTIQTNLVTSIITTLCLILYLLAPKENLFLMFSLPFCPLYVTSLMSILNARERWNSPESSKENSSGEPTNLSSIMFDRNTKMTEATGINGGGTQFNISRKSETGGAHSVFGDGPTDITTGIRSSITPSTRHRGEDDIESIAFSQAPTQTDSTDENRV